MSTDLAKKYCKDTFYPTLDGDVIIKNNNCIPAPTTVGPCLNLTIKNLYNTCITKHTPDGITEQPVISDDEFNNMRDDKLNNENNWWDINAKDTAISNINEKYSTTIKDIILKFSLII